MSRSARSHPPVARLSAGRAAIRWRGAPIDQATSLDVEVDGHRMWSTRLEPTSDGAVRLPWPPSLTPHLHGMGSITVRQLEDGAELAAGRYRLAARPLALRSNAPALAELAARGATVDKWGKLTMAASPELHRLLIDGMIGIIELLERDGRVVAITGGTLLGAIREGSMLERDDDVDLLLYVGEVTPAEVSLCSYEIERLLVHAGYEVIRHSDAHLQVPIGTTSSGQHAHVDLFLGFHDRGSYNQPIHVRTESLPVERLLPLGEATIDGRDFPSVRDPEAWLEACYGPGWRAPDPAFRFETPKATRRRFEHWFGTNDFGRHFWERRATAESASREADAAELATLAGPGARVFDVGAGDGGLAAVLAARGCRVIALDFTSAALDAARQRAEGRFEVASLNLADHRAVTTFIVEHGGAGDAFLLFADVLAYVPEQTRANAFRMIRDLIGSSGAATASFPIRASLRLDQTRPDTWHLPLRWVQRELEPFGLRFRRRKTELRRTDVGVRLFARVVIDTGPVDTSWNEGTVRRIIRLLRPGARSGVDSTDELPTDDAGRLARLEAQVAALTEEIDELRDHSRRIAELYDLVMSRLANGDHGTQI